MYVKKKKEKKKKIELHLCQNFKSWNDEVTWKN